MRALDELTVRWAADTLPDACRWLLNTQLLFLRKDVEGKNKDFDNEQWTLDELSWDADIPEAATTAQEDVDGEMAGVSEGQQEQVARGGNDDDRMPPGQDGTAEPPAPKAKVRPIQMGEFLCKCACRRLLQVAKPDIGKVMSTMRQLGVGAPGGGRGPGFVPPAAIRSMGGGPTTQGAGQD